MSKTTGANFRLTRFLDDEEIDELKRAVQECWEEIQRNPDWVRDARALK
jgi:hypothetical protein